MKRQFLRYLSGLIPAMVLFINGNAQVAKASLEMNLKEYILNEAKASTGEGVVITRAVRDFIRRFNNAENVNWFDDRDGFAARFNADGADTKAYYDPAGRWYATIRSYDQDKLPKEVRKLVRSTYYDYNIYLVDEVTAGDEIVYLVKIQDGVTLKTIRVADGEMNVCEDYIKI